MTRIIADTVIDPLILSLSDPAASGGSDNPLLITSAGTITAGISGPADTAWKITNDGMVSDGTGWGISLAGDGYLYNYGSISGPNMGGVEIGGFGWVMNQGAINGELAGVEIRGNGVVDNQGAISSMGFGVDIIGNGMIINQGSIFGFNTGVALGEGAVINQGSIRGSDGFGVVLTDGGSITNSGSITALGSGVSAMNGASTVTNQGLIQGFEGFASGVALAAGSINNLGTILGGYAGIQLGNGTVANQGLISCYFRGIALGGGAVTNQGSILGGVEVSAGSGTVTNQGLIASGASHPGISVLFDPATANNLLVIKPGAVFDGVAEASGGSNSTMELAGGNGAISGIGSGQFNGFDTLKTDSGANWTLNGPNTVATVVNDGSLGVAGSLDVTTAVAGGSTGTFQLDAHSSLEVAAALGIGSKISFAAGSSLVVDSFGQFGENVGTGSYAGPMLENFAGSTVDLQGFGMTGLDMNFSNSSGLLQLTNSASQMATLAFQSSSLGAGTFHFNVDGGTGVFITHG
ncbi:MAG TPA: hypothetical protein VMB34_21490 [Acetobacteraceae bacterium]|nr:hypothetical protein [Acetobacteraceae bacterium]